MKISPNTKISALIKENPAAIETIAGINPAFNKLRNPLLRKILASRVTIAEAAKIGNTEVAVFFEKLSQIGFEPDNASDQISNPENPSVSKPTNIPADIVELDVRQALENGSDPFNEIMGALKTIKPHQALKLINTFEPTPLITILQKRGYSYYTETLSPNLIHTYFYKTGNENPTPELNLTPEAKNFAETSEKFKGNLLEVDVRNMEMPLPMMTILETLPRLQPNQGLFVHHRRVPQYLLPQLTDQGFAIAINQVGPDEVKLLIYKK